MIISFYGNSIIVGRHINIEDPITEIEIYAIPTTFECYFCEFWFDENF